MTPAPDRSRSWLDRLLLGLAGTVMFLMMALTFTDVVGRYLVRSPVPGTFEMVQFLLPWLIFSVLPVITKDETHITVTVLDSAISERGRRIQTLAIQVLSAAVVGLVCVALWRQGTSLSAGRYVSGYLEWPLGPMAYALSALCFLTLLVQLGQIGLTFRAFLTPATWQKR